MRPLKLTFLGTLALATALSGGCSKSTASGGDYGDDPPISTPDEPTPTTPKPTTPNPTQESAKYAGIYAANAPIDFTQQGVLPGLVSPALAALTLADTNPGSAIVNFANAAGVNIPGGSTGRALIGGFLDGQLDNLISPDVQEALNLIANITQIAQTGILKNKITVHTPKADKTVDVELEVVGAGFDFVNIDLSSTHVDVTVPADKAAAAKTSLTATIAPRPNAPVADADLTFSGGSVTVPMGDFLLQAMGPLVFQPRWGVNTLQAALTEIMRDPCANVGVAVNTFVTNNLGFSPGNALGNTICTTAVTLAAAEVMSAITSITIEGVTITNGRVVLYDISQLKPTMDKQSDRLAEGTWTWSFGSADVPSTLAGDRVGVAN